ncbi:MAG: cytochrome c [Caldilineaceae bacterium]|nr:cytochrome c [Caldilineaceae bacterium]
MVLESPAVPDEAAAHPTVQELQPSDSAVEPTEIPSVQMSPEPTAQPSTPVVIDEAVHSESEAEPAELEAQLATGIRVYRAQYCGICHVLTAAGTAGTFGPTHDQMGATALARLADPEYAGDATTPEEYLMESLVDPQRFVVAGYELTPHRMPPFGHLSDQDLQAIVFMLAHQ